MVLDTHAECVEENGDENSALEVLVIDDRSEKRAGPLDALADELNAHARLGALATDCLVVVRSTREPIGFLLFGSESGERPPSQLFAPHVALELVELHGYFVHALEATQGRCRGCALTDHARHWNEVVVVVVITRMVFFARFDFARRRLADLRRWLRLRL